MERGEIIVYETILAWEGIQAIDSRAVKFEYPPHDHAENEAVSLTPSACITFSAVPNSGLPCSPNAR